MRLGLSFWCSWMVVGLLGGFSGALKAGTVLDLPARDIESAGPNRWKGEVLEIFKGRGAILGWYLQAKQAEEVRVILEYSCEKPVDQEYQLSFDGQDRFWSVVVTPPGTWAEVELGRFQVRPGVPLLVLLVPPSNRKYAHPLSFRKLRVEGTLEDNLSRAVPPEIPEIPDASPGFGTRLETLHPGLQSVDLRGGEEDWRITGMALRSPDRLVFTTWDGELVELPLGSLGQPGVPPFRKVARGLSEPMGLAVHQGRVFVSEKNQLTELIDQDGDGAFETLRCVAHDWPATLDYHEYLFGLEPQGDSLYFAASVAMAIRDRTNLQAPLRGSLWKVQMETGEQTLVAGGLRTPNGLGQGPEGTLLVTDNQGEWLPGNKLIVASQDAFYQFRSRPPWHPMDRPVAAPPAVWLPQGEIAASPTQPVLLPEGWGPYTGQVLMGDATYGGLQRAFLEKVEGEWQGAAFHFSQGFRHLFNRLLLTPKGDLMAGGIARGKDWDFIRNVSGLTWIRYQHQPVFEPIAARIRSNGLEIEWTEPLAEGEGWNPAAYSVSRWGYQATQTYGGQKIRHRVCEVRSASVSSDRRRVFLEMPDLIEGEVIHVRMSERLASDSGRPLRTGELWYTANRIPKAMPGTVVSPPEGALAMTVPFFSYSKGSLGHGIFLNFCSGCHSLEGAKLAGPSLKGLMGSRRAGRLNGDADVTHRTADETYIRQSILEPASFVLEGFENVMPPIGELLTKDQLEALVGYLLEATAAP